VSASTPLVNKLYVMLRTGFSVYPCTSIIGRVTNPGKPFVMWMIGGSGSAISSSESLFT